MHCQCGTGFVEQVDGLVGQEAVGYMLGTGAHDIVDDVVVHRDTVKRLVGRPQPFQYLNGFVDRRLGDVNLLEAAYQSARAGKVFVVFLVCSRTDEAYVARLQIGLQHIRGIH